MWIGASSLPTPFQEAAIFIAHYVMAGASVTRSRVKATQADVSTLDPAHRAGPETWDVPPRDTLTATEQEEGKGRREVKKKKKRQTGPPTLFSSSCQVPWQHRGSRVFLPRLPQLATSKLGHKPVTSAALYHSHLSPALVPREFPEKQGCQQRQNQAGWELGWLSLSLAL